MPEYNNDDVGITESEPTKVFDTTTKPLEQKFQEMFQSIHSLEQNVENLTINQKPISEKLDIISQQVQKKDSLNNRVQLVDQRIKDALIENKKSISDKLDLLHKLCSNMLEQKRERKIIDYKLVVNGESKELNKKVNELLHDGWELRSHLDSSQLGGIGESWYQVMVKYGEVDDTAVTMPCIDDENHQKPSALI